MITSLRTISTALFVLSIFILTLSFTGTILRNCSTTYCSSSVLLYTADFSSNPFPQSTTQQTTTQLSTSENPYSFDSVAQTMRIIGTYTIILSIFVLIALEIKELHYLRYLIPKRKY